MKTYKLFFVLILMVGLSENIAKADFVFSEPTIVPNINTTSADGCGSISSDGLELYMASFHPYGGDECHSDIYVATRLSVNDAWGTPTKLGPPVNTDGPENFPSYSADGLELYFADGWHPIFVSGCTYKPGGYGGSDIWVSTRTTRDDPWGEPRNLGPTVNGSGSEYAPSISPDGLSLYFQFWPGDYGRNDLYVAKRPTKNDPWGPPENLGSLINGNTNDIGPVISPDNLSLYFSRGGNNDSTYDIYVSRRSSIAAPWEAPVPFEPVNSSLSEYGLIFAPGCSTLYFSRSDNWIPWDMGTFPATTATYDIWQVEVTPIVDLNNDGIVDAEDICIMSDHWHTNEPLCDIAPAPLGDGFVDVQDLIILAEHLFESQP